MGPDAAPAMQAIEKSLSDPNATNRAVAAYALGKIGPAASAALPKLARGADLERDPLVRVASAFALVNIAPQQRADRASGDPGAGARSAKPGGRRPPRRGRSSGRDRQAGPRSRRIGPQGGLDDSDETVRKAALEAWKRWASWSIVPRSQPCRFRSGSRSSAAAHVSPEACRCQVRSASPGECFRQALA